ncbi:teichoic acids export ABC transporter ATP-binding subunit TagH [Clostridium tertium]|uniref:teichoic acids export ABC transporter ATP-binding subunit TagH n=1 Tax=Clostridium tertium TaxID=1559 RepID=UPI002FE480D5
MNENKYSIIAKNISKGYKMYSSSKEKLLDLILPKGAGKTFYALKDISFEVEKGEVVGLLGLNGSGKSTLSNILGGVSMPTSGEIEINGEASLIAIGIGMNNFLSGIENIELKALMMGYKKDEIEEIKQEIIDFADIGEFINQPLRTYSSGMRARLGFAISVYTNPDILVIDEALSVGDPTFTQKCLDKMNEFKESGKTIFFVSHSLQQVKQFCNKAIWLEYGRLREYGDVDLVLPKYQEYINKINKMSEVEKVEYKKEVLKNQEHSLLKDFKLIDNNLKKFVPNGRVIKSVTLINNENTVKEVFFNIDLSTFAFGFIPSIIRKRYENAIFILILQIINFFVIDFPYSIITNFFVTGIASILVARGYIDYLIENKKFIPYSIWKKADFHEEEKVKNKIHQQNKINKLATIISIVFIAFASIFSSSYIIKDFTILNSEKINVKDYMIIVVSNVKNEQTIDSLLILNSKGSSSLNGVVYPGKIQVSYKDNIDKLSKLANLKNIDGLKEILESNFKVKVSDYIIINKDDIKMTDGKYIEIYEAILSNILTLEEKDFEKRVNEIIEKYPKIDKELLSDFYNEFNNKQIDIAEVKYKTVLLSDLVEDAVLKALNITDKGNYEFITTDTRILQNNSIIKNINKKYEEYLNKNSEEEVIEDDKVDIENDLYEDIEDPIWNNQWETRPNNSGGGTTQTPPSNNGEGTTEIPPSNSGGGTTETPPSNGGGTTETPPNNSGGGTTETPPNNSGGGTTETPPNNSGGGTTETPPNNSGGGTTEIPPSNSGGGTTETPPSNGGGTTETPPSNNGNSE